MKRGVRFVLPIIMIGLFMLFSGISGNHLLAQQATTKEKEQKEAITGEVAGKTGSELAGMIGHTAILYRPQADPEKRKIRLPAREED